jgi:type I restriction enzyme, S subunit
VKAVGSREAWRSLPFAELVENVTERVDDPSTAGVDRYVGLEHLDSGMLRIGRWGSPSDVEATKLRFKPGDVIFGRRRAYQRKVAQADFEGICSAHALVLRAHPEHVLPDFLPFFLQSEPFFRRALAISVGSLSPTINWKVLARERFAVPPLDKQQEIARLLGAAAIDASAAEAALAAARITQQALGAEYFEGQLTGATVVSLEGVLSRAQYGLSIKAGDSGDIPILGMGQMVEGRMDAEGAGRVSLSGKELKTYRLNAGDILFNRTNSIDHVGRVALNELEDTVVFASYLIRLTVDPEVADPRYIFEYLTSRPGQRRIRRFITRGVSQANINATNLKTIETPLPSLEVQREFVRRAEELDGVVAALDARRHASRRLLITLADRIFDPPA